MTDQRDFYSWNERMAREYNPHDYHTKSVFFVRYVESMRVKAILRFLAPCAQDTILEMGCGAGNIMEQFTNGRIIGIDLSPSLLNLARGKTYHTQTGLLQSYGESTPFQNAVFDKVYCSEVLEHVPEPERICRETHRVLKEGGRFVVSVPNENCINFFKSISRRLHIDGLIRRFSGYRYAADMTDEWHLHSFNTDLLQQVLKECFVIEEMTFVPSRLLPIRIVARCKRR